MSYTDYNVTGMKNMLKMPGHQRVKLIHGIHIIAVKHTQIHMHASTTRLLLPRFQQYEAAVLNMVAKKGHTFLPLVQIAGKGLRSTPVSTVTIHTA